MDVNYTPRCAYCGNTLNNCICLEEDIWWPDTKSKKLTKKQIRKIIKEIARHEKKIEKRTRIDWNDLNNSECTI